MTDLKWMLKCGEMFAARLEDQEICKKANGEEVVVANGRYELWRYGGCWRITIWRDSRPTCAWAMIADDAIHYGAGACAPTDEERTEIDAMAPEIRALPAPRNLYIRFGQLPRGGRSKNHATGTAERGVSCYCATSDPVRGGWMLNGSASPGAAIQAACGRYGGIVLLLAGERIGLGSDGEPLLSEPQIVARLKWDSEIKRFV